MTEEKVTYVDEIVGTNCYIDGELQPKIEGMIYKIDRAIEEAEASLTDIDGGRCG